MRFIFEGRYCEEKIESLPEEILCKLLENELSAISFDTDQTWSFATQARFRFTKHLPHLYHTGNSPGQQQNLKTK